ncbi:MAG: tetratricopeptide repeat protein [Parachlamydiaceae bacterium]
MKVIRLFLFSTLLGLLSPELSSHENDIENFNEELSEDCLNLLAIHHLEQGNDHQAESAYTQLIKKYPQSPYIAEALYWRAVCAEKLKKDPLLIQSYRKQVFENYPSSPFAPPAYFAYYTYRDYLQGDPITLKHLRGFHHLFPNSPLQMTAYYLIGLNYKRECKSPTGRTLHKKNPIKAIQAFSKVELAFESLNQKKKIASQEVPYYLTIRYRAMLERALANQSIALDSVSTKRTIYAQYAQDLFIQINRELEDPSHPFATYFVQEPFHKIQEENLYLLTKCYLKFENEEAAKSTIDQLLAKYAASNTTKGYYLSRIHYERGMLAMRHQEYLMAEEAFNQAESCNENNVLSTDQKLELWIQQSECAKALQQMDKAMLILSKVINDSSISSLRVKAMYLRAEIYALQGRHELARKQLTATSNKGGEWATKAKIQLEETYGSH